MANAPPGWRLMVHDELASTQDAAIAAAARGQAGHYAILAHRQTAGRGRRARDWVAPAGNLNLSVLLRPTDTAIEPGRWSLLCGIALHEAVARFMPAASLWLKWPNDLFRGDGKLGGILIDSQVGAQGGFDWVVAGFGVNLASAPAIDGRLTASLADAAVPPQALAYVLLECLDHWLARDFAQVRAAWLARSRGVAALTKEGNPVNKARALPSTRWCVPHQAVKSAARHKELLVPPSAFAGVWGAASLPRSFSCC